MTYYHCSPISGLKVLSPTTPEYFEKSAGVYMTTSLPMALMYSIRNFEYSYGYTKEGHIYFEEYFPNALMYLYCGKRASLYLCNPNDITLTKIPTMRYNSGTRTPRSRYHIIEKTGKKPTKCKEITPNTTFVKFRWTVAGIEELS